MALDEALLEAMPRLLNRAAVYGGRRRGVFGYCQKFLKSNATLPAVVRRPTVEAWCARCDWTYSSHSDNHECIPRVRWRVIARYHWIQMRLRN